MCLVLYISSAAFYVSITPTRNARHRLEPNEFSFNCHATPSRIKKKNDNNNDCYVLVSVLQMNYKGRRGGVWRFNYIERSISADGQ